MEYSVDPPEFEKYIKSISYSDNNNILLIDVELRAKRIPFFCQIKRDNDNEPINILEFIFNTFEYEHSDIVYPQSLGKWTGYERPILKIELNDVFEIESYNSGRYTARVILSKNLERHYLK